MQIIQEVINGIPNEPKIFHSTDLEEAFNYYVQCCKENGVEFNIEPKYDENLDETLAEIDEFLSNYVGSWDIYWWKLR